MPTRFPLATILLAVLPAAALAQAAPAADARVTAEFIKAAEAGAPASISAAATISRLEPDGKSTTIRPGTNGFTCTIVPDGSQAPVCGDANAWQWFVSAMQKQPRPVNAQPGIAYMARGAVHYERPDGTIAMERGADTRDVREPPHWMVLWPVDSATTGLPTRPNAGGAYIMFAGTPFSHLMIYQDPKLVLGGK